MSMATAALLKKPAQRHLTKRSIPERNKHVNAIRSSASGSAMQSVGWALEIFLHHAVHLKVVDAKVTQADMSTDPILRHELLVHIRRMNSPHALVRNPLHHRGFGL